MCNALLRPMRDVLSNHSLQSVSLARVKEQLRLFDTEDDNLLVGYIESATAFLEEWSGYYMMPGLVTAFYNNCNNCRFSYLMGKRPFNSISLIEVKQDGTYVPLIDSDYFITERTWDASVCIDNSIEIDSQCNAFSSNCVDVIDPVKVAYNVGNRRTLGITSITFSDETATASSDNPHGLKDDDLVIISDSGSNVFDGTYSVTVVDQLTFTYTILGTPAGPVTTGVLTIPEIPAQLQLAVMQMVAKMNENRGDCCDECGQVPCSSQSLAKQFRRIILRASAGVSDVCCCR